MPRKSKLRLMFTGRWIRWALCSKLFEWIPSLGRASNFPLRATFAGDFADVVLEDEAQDAVICLKELTPVICLKALHAGYMFEAAARRLYA
jgi:hypothetical protein